MEETKKCPFCGEIINKDAKRCPKCQADLRSWFVKHWIISIFLVLFVLYLIGNASEETNTQVNPQRNSEVVEKEEVKKVEPAIIVSAKELARAYEENEVKADKIYKDKTIEITGKIYDIGVIFSQTYITLSSEKDFSLTQAQCMFSDESEITKIENKKKGDTITVIGVVEGKSMNVGVKNCKFK